MKRVLLLATLLLFVSGCANHIVPVSPAVPKSATDTAHLLPSFGSALLYSHHKAPLSYDFNNTKVSTKSGRSGTKYIYDPLFSGVSAAWEDASVEKAAKNGGLTEVHYVDYEVERWLGIFVRFDIIAYGI